jgi:tetratricopeptide (TPR) repeat protein
MGEKLMVLAQYENDGLRVFAHEMSHDVSSAYFARQPRWLGEGLAQFLETLKIERSRDRVVLGVPDLSFAMTPAGLRTDYKTPIPIPAVFERERVGELPDYPTSWALIFYLANEEGRGFNEFQKALFRGQEPDDAWKASFPAYADAAGLRALDGKVQAAVRELIKTKRYRAATVPFLEYAGKIETRTMQDSEVRSLRAELRLNSPHPRSEHRFILGWARDDAQAAARENPAEVRAIALLIQLAESRHEKLQLARSATVAAPDDYRAWLLTDLALADEEGSPDEEAGRLSDLERAVSLSPANPKALERLARAYTRAGKGAKAIPFIRKSLDAYPDNASALDTYALIASVQGSCPAARELERMAVNRLPHRPGGESKRDSPSTPFEKRAARMRDRLAEYERACPGN